MNTKSALAALALTLLTAGGARAGTFNLMLDHAERLPVAGAASVIVANPAVADVTVVDSRTVYVMGRSAGSTNIVVLDRSGRQVFSGEVNVNRLGQPVAVYHGVERVDFTCAQNCAKNEGAATANPFTAMLNAAAAAQASSQAAAQASAAPVAHP